MKAKPKGPEQDDLFRARLVEIIDMRHELVKLAALIDWGFFEREWAGFFPSEAGTIPAISPGETLLLVEGVLSYKPPFRVNMLPTTLSEVTLVRPRFASGIAFPDPAAPPPPNACGM